MASKKVKAPRPFNPLDTKHLGESVAEELLKQPVGPLPPEEQFSGAGVYAIYYHGGFPLYKEIARLNSGERKRWPIYVGKAVPAGARKGGYGLGAEPGFVLCRRLLEHARSIEETSNLQISDFVCRFLVVDDIWIPLAEALLIETLSPLWNKRVDGFGNHDPGSGRHKQMQSAWDVVHPGRSWAQKLQPRKEALKVVREGATKYLVEHAPEVERRTED